MKQRFFLNGPGFEKSDEETVERFKVAEAAIRAMYPKAYIFNTQQYFHRKYMCIHKKFSPYKELPTIYEQMERDNVFFAIKDSLERGTFNHMVLMEDCLLEYKCLKFVMSMSNGYIGRLAEAKPDEEVEKPCFFFLSYEMAMKGRELLVRMAEAEHSNQKREEQV